MNLAGLKIVEVRGLTASEMTDEGWPRGSEPTAAIVLSDGTVLFASRDSEGNGPGQIFGKSPQGDAFQVSAAVV